MIKRAIRRILGRAGYTLFKTRDRYARDGLYTVHDDRFRRTPEFQAAYARGLKASRGVDPQFEWRVHVALWAGAAALRAPGDFVECGVNAGFVSSALMRFLDWRKIPRKFYLIDTFQGPVLEQFCAEEIAAGRAQIAKEFLAAGAYVTDVARVRDNFAEWPNAVVVPGTVPEVLPSLPIETVAFLHIDLNCALPERAALEFFWDRLSPGAIVLLDDYAYFGQQKQGEAIDSVAKRVGASVLALPTGQGLIIK
jgi:hypothetical protein